MDTLARLLASPWRKAATVSVLTLAAIGILALWTLFSGASVTYELDNGNLVTFWGERSECIVARDAVEADDGSTVWTTAPWGQKHQVRHVWCYGR